MTEELSTITAARHLTTNELEAGLTEIRRSPSDIGSVKLIVRRPRPDEREIIEEGELDLVMGMLGDNWSTRGCSHTPDGSSDPDKQITVMNSRAIALIAQSPERWHLAGDQFFIDMDLSALNLPPGTRLALGSAIIEVSHKPHNGCGKFVERFGLEAMLFVNSPVGKQLHLRGINARVVRAGIVRVGDTVTKIGTPSSP